MMPTVEVNPSSSARRPIVKASWGVCYAASHHGIDVDVKLGVFLQEEQFAVEHLKALLGNLIRQDVVDGDLQMLQAGAIEALDPLGGQQVAVGDHAGDDAVAAYAGDQQVEIGVEQGLAAGDGDDGGAERRQVVQPGVHGVHRDGLGEIVELVAVGARQVAAAHGDDVRQNGVLGRGQPLADHLEFTRAPVGGQKRAA